MKLFSFWSKSLWPWEIKAIDVHSKICFYNNPWPLLLYLGNANFYRMMVKIQIWKINFFIYLLRDWKTWKVFASFFFYVHINVAFCFYIYGSLQVLNCDPFHYFDAAEIRSAKIKKMLYLLGHHHTLCCLMDLKV